MDKRNNQKKEMFVIMPDCKDTFEGIRVTKDTKIEFKNRKVEQKIENLKLYSKTTIIGENFKSITDLEMDLQDGEILLLEQENRGYFLARNLMIGTVDQAIEEYEFIKERINVMNGEK